MVINLKLFLYFHRNKWMAKLTISPFSISSRVYVLGQKCKWIKKKSHQDNPVMWDYKPVSPLPCSMKTKPEQLQTFVSFRTSSHSASVLHSTPSEGFQEVKTWSCQLKLDCDLQSIPKMWHHLANPESACIGDMVPSFDFDAKGLG